MNQLISTSKKLDKAFSIAQTVFFALAVASGALVALTIAGYLMGFDTSTFGEGYGTLSIGFLDLKIAEKFTPSGEMMMLEAVIMLALCLVCFLLGHRGIQYIRGILQPMSLGQPFDGAVSVNLSKLAWLGIFLGIALNCVKLAEMIFAVFVYRIPDLVTSPGIIHATPNFTVELDFLVYSVLLFLLSYVFKYGEELQQLSDETL